MKSWISDLENMLITINAVYDSMKYLVDDEENENLEKCRELAEEIDNTKLEINENIEKMQNTVRLELEKRNAMQAQQNHDAGFNKKLEKEVRRGIKNLRKIF